MYSSNTTLRASNGAAALAHLPLPTAAILPRPLYSAFSSAFSNFHDRCPLRLLSLMPMALSSFSRLSASSKSPLSLASKRVVMINSAAAWSK